MYVSPLYTALYDRVVRKVKLPPAFWYALPVALLGLYLIAGEDFLVVCCPERVMPGKLLRNLAQRLHKGGPAGPAVTRVDAQGARSLRPSQRDATDRPRR